MCILAEALPLLPLVHLDLGGLKGPNELHHEQELARAINIPSLTCLNISSDDLGKDGAMMIRSNKLPFPPITCPLHGMTFMIRE